MSRNAGAFTFTWVKTPEHIARNAEQWAKDIPEKAADALRVVAVWAQNEMRDKARWRNVTGNARRGLRVEVDRQGKLITMYFIHSVEYGVHLELARAGRYAIIVPTMHRTIAEAKQALKGVAER